MKKLLLILFTFSAQNSVAFDLEDYAGTYRATSEAHKKAHIELRLAEDTFFTLLNSHRTLLPMPTATISNMGSKLGSCSYLKECSEAYSKTKILPELNAILADSKIQTVISDDDRGVMLSATQQYYNDFNTDIPNNQKILLEEQSADIVYNDDVNTFGFNLNGTYPFTAGSYADDTLTEYRADRDAYLKALNEWKLSIAPDLAARAAFAAAVQNYFNNTGCANFAEALSIDDYILAGGI